MESALVGKRGGRESRAGKELKARSPKEGRGEKEKRKQNGGGWMQFVQVIKDSMAARSQKGSSDASMVLCLCSCGCASFWSENYQSVFSFFMHFSFFFRRKKRKRERRGRMGSHHPLSLRRHKHRNGCGNFWSRLCK